MWRLVAHEGPASVRGVVAGAVGDVGGVPLGVVCGAVAALC